MSTRVKICGVMRPEDARVAVEAGASAVGMVFWPKSPRMVSLEAAAEIVGAVRGRACTVGVFVDQPPAHVAEVARAAGLDAIQLHGHEAIAEYEIGLPIVKSLAVGLAWHVGMLADLPASVLPLLDVHDTARKGGTGQVIDWQLASAAASVRKLALAGGLTPENVGRAVRIVRPHAVDVSSGVEAAPGIKDPARIRAFVEAVAATGGPVPRGLF